MDQGLRPDVAGEIVAATYPETHGDTFYRWADPSDPGAVAVGVYALWNDLRGDQSPLTGTKVSDDARTIAQFWRLNRRNPTSSVRISDKPDFVVRRIVEESIRIIRDGGRFEPTEVREDDPKERATSRVASMIARNDGAADYLASLTPPTFGL